MACHIYVFNNRFISQAKTINFVAILTFEQPLFWKAYKILDSKNDDTDIKAAIIKIGGLHIEMSFVGTIGHFFLQNLE